MKAIDRLNMIKNTELLLVNYRKCKEMVREIDMDKYTDEGTFLGSEELTLETLERYRISNPGVSLPFEVTLNNGALANRPVGGKAAFVMTHGKAKFDFENLELTIPTMHVVAGNKSKFYTNAGKSETFTFLNNGDVQLVTYDFDLDKTALRKVYSTRSEAGVGPNEVILIAFQSNIKSINSEIPYETVGGNLPIQYDQSSLVYSLGPIRKLVSGTTVILKFSNQSMYAKSYWYNGFFNVDQEEIVIPHNNSLVFNYVTKKLEVIGGQNRFNSFLVAFNHQGILKYQNINIVESEADTEYTTYFSSDEIRFDFMIDQDAAAVEDEIWICGSSSATEDGTIYRLNRDTFEQVGILKHDLGHMGSVDYRGGYLLETSGIKLDDSSNITPRLIFYKNPYEENSLKMSDANCFSIDFKDGEKVLEKNTDWASGSVFGENNRVVYMVGAECIYKLLIGVGEQDLSDKTTDKSDMNSWGDFVSGKGDNEYNGTAKIIERFYGTAIGINQGISYWRGNIYVMSGFDDISCKVIEFSNGSYRIKERLTYLWMDENGSAKQIEPEAVFFIDRELYLGGRTQDDSFLVHTEV